MVRNNYIEKTDPIERTKRFRQIKAELEKKINERLIAEGIPTESRFLGWCFIYWATKKEILKNEYGIDWKSPTEMNPNITYD